MNLPRLPILILCKELQVLLPEVCLYVQPGELEGLFDIDLNKLDEF